jgi:peptide subunit release factor 1 (eRF1)
MTLSDHLERLAAVEPLPYPVISLYLNTQPNQVGRDQHDAFVRKELKARAETYPPGSSERTSLDRDIERIERYLENELQSSANGVAIFACDAADLFETLQLDAPIDEHWLSIGDQPHVYPLARMVSQYPRYAALLADTTSARILVIAEGKVASRQAVESVKTRRTSQGGWSQARFQRRIENIHLHHVKDVIDALERIVQRENIDRIVIAGDPVVLPMLRDQMPKHLAEKIVDRISVATHAPEQEIIDASLDAMRKWNEQSDRDLVEDAVGAYRAGGLGVIGPDATLLALTNGQVDELLLPASVAQIGELPQTPQTRMAIANDSGIAEAAVEMSAAGEAARASAGKVRLADELVTKAQQTGARVTFIEDAELLAPYGGVAAILRYRI